MSLLLAIIGHLVGDYLLQNDWMALNKKAYNGSLPCTLHAVIWTCAVCLFSGWPMWNAPYFTFSSTFFVLLITHYIQDRTQIVRFWMTRINRQPKFVEPPMAPWSLIVVDNVWHIVTLWAVWRFLSHTP